MDHNLAKSLAKDKGQKVLITGWVLIIAGSLLSIVYSFLLIGYFVNDSELPSIGYYYTSTICVIFLGLIAC